MDSIHTAKKIFDASLHPYQIHSSAISCELRDFFKQNSNNSIEFWDCPSVVATTRHSRTNDLTTSKALQWAIK